MSDGVLTVVDSSSVVIISAARVVKYVVDVVLTATVVVELKSNKFIFISFKHTKMRV